MNAEHKRKIGDSNKGKSNKYKGKKRPSEVGEKVSKSKMGHEVSEETREKLRKAFTGKKYDKKTLEIKLSKEYLTKKRIIHLILLSQRVIFTISYCLKIAPKQYLETIKIKTDTHFIVIFIL